MAALAVWIGMAAAYAGDDDDTVSASPPSVYDRLLRIIGLEGGANIDYSERSPLVVPPTRDLPPPAANALPSVADWPKDPDIAQRAKARAKEKPKPHGDYVVESSRPLRPNELSVAGAAASSSGGRPSRADPDAQDLSPAATEPNKKSLFSFDFLNPNKTEYATFTGEPDRTSLTEPPAGYLTPSPDQPYGVGPDQKKYKVPSVADRATPTSGSAAGN